MFGPSCSAGSSLTNSLLINLINITSFKNFIFAKNHHFSDPNMGQVQHLYEKSKSYETTSSSYKQHDVQPHLSCIPLQPIWSLILLKFLRKQRMFSLLVGMLQVLQ